MHTYSISSLISLQESKCSGFHHFFFHSCAEHNDIRARWLVNIALYRNIIIVKETYGFMLWRIALNILSFDRVEFNQFKSQIRSMDMMDIGRSNHTLIAVIVVY